jgi:hypothetical protein
MRQLRYLAAAFNLRPWGMPIPPNWFILAATLLIGHLAHPGFYLIGLGVEIAYITLLSSSRRFQRLVDSRSATPETGWQQERQQILQRLTSDHRSEQQALESLCSQIADRLHRDAASRDQVDDLARLCWLHLRLLAALQQVSEVVVTGQQQANRLMQQAQQLTDRLANETIDPRLRQSLEQQLLVIQQRRHAHEEARQQQAILAAELDRIRQQVALIHERNLLASDEQGASDSINAITASLNEAGRWFNEQQTLFNDLGDPWHNSPDRRLFDQLRQ